MPDYDDEDSPLTSSGRFSSIRFRRPDVASKRRSELKAAISGPHTFNGGGVSTTALGDAPLRTLNGTRSPYPNLGSTVRNGLTPPPQTFVQGVRRNSDIPLRQHYSGLAWPSNHPAITPIHGSPHYSTRTTHKNPRRVGISKPLVLDHPRFSSTSGISRKRSPRSSQTNRGSRLSRTMATGIAKGNPDEVTSLELTFSDKQNRDPNLLDVLSDEFDPRTLIESLPALNLDLSTGAASFGSVKQRIRGVGKPLRTSRTMLLSVPELDAKPDLVYTDDSDSFSSPPSTPSTPVWETTATSSSPKTDPKLAGKLELADVHAQIQAMIDSTNRPFSIESEDHPGEGQEPPNIQRNDIPPSLRPSNPMYKSFPRLATTHKRSVSSPPLGSGTYHAYPPDFSDRLLYRPVTPVVPHNPTPPAPSPSKTMPTSPADLITPSTPTKTPSERSDSPSVYSQPSPSSQIDNATPTSSNTSSPDHPYAKSKHERLLAAISEGISSPTRPGSAAPSSLGSGHDKANNTHSANSSLDTRAPGVPLIVVTDPNDDDLVYSESDFSIVDMYTGPTESSGAGLRRRRTRTTNSYQPRQAFDAPMLRNSVSLNSPRLSRTTKEGSPSSQGPLKKRASIFRPGLPSSFLSMSTLHEVEAAEAIPRDRKSFYAAVGLKGLFRRSTSKGSPLGQVQVQTSGAAGATGGGGGARPGSTSLAASNAEAGDDALKGGWGFFKRKR